MSDYQKLSADLSRITEFLISGNESLAGRFSGRVVKLYSGLPGRVGKDNLSEYLRKIANLEGGRMRAAERAMTASILLSR